MKRSMLTAASFIFAALFAVSAFAQAPATPVGKIGLVNTAVFADEKAGITRVRTALTSLDTEFKPATDELRTMGTRLTALGTEINNLQKTAGAGGAVPVNTSALEAKIDEYKKLETAGKRKEEDLKAAYERRYQVVVGPITNEILRAMNEFAKQKGYAMILDGAKLMDSGLLMGYDEKYDVTKEFVTFYNARPATTASAAAPK